MSLNGSFKELHEDVTAALLNTTRTAAQLSNEDLIFLRTSTPKLARALDKQNARLLRLAQSLARSASDGTAIRPPELSSADSVDEEWRRVVDVVDNLFEKADICLDEYTGVINQHASSNKVPEAPNRNAVPSGRSDQNQQMAKPQLFFRNVPRNSERAAFKPLLSSKPHARKSLEESIGSGHVSGDAPQQWGHPYENEIHESRYPSFVYTQTEPIPAQPFDTTSATYVDTFEGIVEMLSELRKAREIAIDLEHHDVRSYLGLVSLMQISTREKDWIVDTLKPWREDLQILNAVFADPDIVKVLHGAFMDIMWLQRDLGLYVVGLFDTFHAVSALGYKKRSLAFLLKKFVNFDAQKQYQLADWRTRPLTHEMFEYARSDTHFLLYVFDNLRNELVKHSNENGNLVDTVLEESKKVALQRYERPVYDAELGMGSSGWYNMLIRQSAVFNKEQFAVFKAVHQWRDDVARKEDESIHYVMPNNSLYSVAREMPSQQPQLLGCLSRVSDPLRRRLSELLSIVEKAKIRGAEGMEMKDALRQHPASIEYEARKAEIRKEALVSKQPTLAEIAKRENLDVSGDQLITKTSAFWGQTLTLRNAELNGLQAIQHSLQVPLPALSTGAVSGGDTEINGEMKPTAHTDTARLEDRTGQDQQSLDEDEVFIIRERNIVQKRKAQESEQSLEAIAADEIKLGSAQGEETKKTKKRRKSNHRQSEKAKGELAGKEDANGSGSDQGLNPELNPEIPFDYNIAPSVLHAKLTASEKTRVQVFDPYKKAMNAPKGLGKAHREIQGKSATFKS